MPKRKHDIIHNRQWTYGMLNNLNMFVLFVPYFNNPFELLKVNKWFKNNLKRYKLYYESYKESIEPFMLENYKFKYLDLYINQHMSDYYLEYLSGIHTLKLHYIGSVTNNGLQYLAGINTLHLECNGIADSGLKYLKGIRELDLLYGWNITDDGLKHLVGIEKLVAVRSTKITDTGLKYLAGIQHLDLLHNDKITDIGLNYIMGVKELHLHWNKKITGEILQNLITNGLKVFQIFDCGFVTDETLQYLSGIHTLTILHNASMITDFGLKYLKGIQSLELTDDAHNITDKGMKYLKGIKRLSMTYNRNVTDKGLKYLSGIEYLYAPAFRLTKNGLKYIKNCHLTNTNLHVWDKLIA